MSVSEAIPGASRLRNQNEILIEKSDEAFKNKIKKLSFWNFFVCKCFILFFEKDSPQGLRRLRLLIPLFAKNSRLGYFLNANNPQVGNYSSLMLRVFL